MSLLEWTGNMSVGDDVMDHQHKRLIRLINELGDAMEESHGTDVIAHILKELKNYALIHFHSEERFFDTLPYKESICHKQAHEYFIQKINEFEEVFMVESLPPTVNVLFFMRDWLYSHIMVVDKRYSFGANSRK